MHREVDVSIVDASQTVAQFHINFVVAQRLLRMWPRGLSSAPH